MSIYIDHRPNDFFGIHGNEDTIKSLRSVLDKDRKPHAFLFTGPSGCGKTTFARITAKELGCKMEHDFYEVDSAHYRGIDSIREMRSNMRMGSLAGGSVRVWLLDECHQMTKDAQTALLKALEDTPSHVYIILATTDPQKLLPTIRNRCSIFTVNSLDKEEMMELLSGICKAEGKRISIKILQTIADHSQGSPRAALVLLDKIIDMKPNDMARAIDSIKDNQTQAIELCRAILGKANWNRVSGILNDIQGEEPESVRRLMLSYFEKILLGDGAGRIFNIMDCFRSNYFDTGRAGLIMSCYEAWEQQK